MAFLTDYKYYKWIALLPGWIIGDLLGAISSYFLVDTILSNKKGDISFEIALLRIFSLLIKSDDEVRSEEIRTVRNFFIKTFGKNKSKRAFKEIKTSYLKSVTLDELIKVVKLKVSPTKYYSIIQMLYAVASSDGKISLNEDLFIENVALEFGYDKVRLNTIRHQFVGSKQKSKKYSKKIMDCLAILGLRPGVDFSEIKKSYRVLVKEYHPDKLSGMGQGIKDLAKEKFQKIQEAYEFLNENYV